MEGKHNIKVNIQKFSDLAMIRICEFDQKPNLHLGSAIPENFDQFCPSGFRGSELASSWGAQASLGI